MTANKLFLLQYIDVGRCCTAVVQSMVMEIIGGSATRPLHRSAGEEATEIRTGHGKPTEVKGFGEDANAP